MHETALFRRLISQILAAADGQPVVTITLQVGALAAISPEHLATHLAEAAAGTLAAGAHVRVTQATDPTDPAAQAVTLERLTVEAPTDQPRTSHVAHVAAHPAPRPQSPHTRRRGC